MRVSSWRHFATVLVPLALSVSCGRDFDNPLDPTGQPRPVGTVRITDPSSGATVSTLLPVRGTYSADVADDIWLFVWPAEAPGRGWPQTDNPTVGRPAVKVNGAWSVPASLGGPPQRYDIVVYTATPSASGLLRETLIGWSRTGDFTGIVVAALPQGLNERHRITVTKVN